MKAVLNYPHPNWHAKQEIRMFSDATFNISKNSLYGQSELLLRIYFDKGHNLYQVLDLMSVERKGMCNSSYGVEILAWTEIDDREF